MSKLRIPSAVSVVAQSDDVIALYAGRKPVGSVSVSSLGDVLRLDVGVSIVARGDLLSPAFRRGVATDTRLCYSTRRADRTEVLRLLSEIAAAWDTHRSMAALAGEP